MKEFGDDGEDTREVTGSCRALEQVGRRPGHNARHRLAPTGIHGARLGHEQAIDSSGCGEFAIAVQIAGITREVFVRTELQRIDEDTDDDTVGELAGSVHEAQVALVKVSHGGNESDRMGSRALRGRPRAHLG